MDEPDFRAGRLSIRYLEDHLELGAEERLDEGLVQAVAAAAALLEDRERGRRSPRIRARDAAPSTLARHARALGRTPHGGSPLVSPRW